MKRFFLAAFILYSSVFLANFLISKGPLVHFGKDGGLLFRIFSLCFFSSIFFYLIKNDILYIVIGFFIGLLSYLLVFFIYIITYMAIGGSSNSWVLPVVADHLVATSIVLIVGIFLRKRA